MRNRVALAGGLVLITIFLTTVTVAVLDRARAASGYPAYSSLNNGEEGLKAYYDTLTRLGFETSRNFLPLHKLAGSPVDIIYAAPSLQSFEYASNSDLELFEKLAGQGGRVIVLLSSEGFVERSLRSNTNLSLKSKGRALKPPSPTLKTRWGIRVAYRELPRAKDTPASLFSGLDLVPATWHFSSWTNEWIPSHMRDYSPLFLERRFGQGGILLIANARLFTNRELLLEPDAQLLSSLPGAHHRVLFDESHLGLEDTGTVAGLAAAHHLQWLLLGFVILAAIYVWRSSFSFVPPINRSTDSSVVVPDTGFELASLLQQSIPPRAILLAVAEEWNRSLPLLGRTSQTGTGGKRGAHTIDGQQLARVRALRPEQAAGLYNELASHEPMRRLD